MKFLAIISFTITFLACSPSDYELQQVSKAEERVRAIKHASQARVIERELGYQTRVFSLPIDGEEFEPRTELLELVLPYVPTLRKLSSLYAVRVVGGRGPGFDYLTRYMVLDFERPQESIAFLEGLKMADLNRVNAKLLYWQKRFNDFTAATGVHVSRSGAVESESRLEETLGVVQDLLEENQSRLSATRVRVEISESGSQARNKYRDGIAGGYTLDVPLGSTREALSPLFDTEFVREDHLSSVVDYNKRAARIKSKTGIEHLLLYSHEQTLRDLENLVESLPDHTIWPRQISTRDSFAPGFSLASDNTFLLDSGYSIEDAMQEYRHRYRVMMDEMEGLNMIRTYIEEQHSSRVEVELDLWSTEINEAGSQLYELDSVLSEIETTDVSYIGVNLVSAHDSRGEPRPMVEVKNTNSIRIRIDAEPSLIKSKLEEIVRHQEERFRSE